MNEEQEKAFEPFAKKAKEKNVHLNMCLWATAAVLNSNNWKDVLDDIIRLIEESKDGDDFAMRLLKKYPGQKVAPEA